MRGSSARRVTRAGTGRRLVRGLAAALFLVVAAASQAQAQSPSPTPTPTPSPTPTVINSSFSAGSTVTNLGSNFLERLGNQATSGFGKAMRSNPGGGGASESTEATRFRSWAEGY